MVPFLVQEHVAPARIDIIKKKNVWYNYRDLGVKVKAQNTLHDVPNCCWHVDIDGERAFYATDLATTEGLEAKGYDLYLVEANRSKDDIEEAIHRKQKTGVFAYEQRVLGTHLFEEQAMEFLYENMDRHSRYILMHRHRER